ncbi:MAG: hypothetical protein E6R13_08570 [Spirochaetes bacterium]|nr:MAG: hypothetical protein E6R13_08570 [Spirochaetota bacterium]
MIKKIMDSIKTVWSSKATDKPSNMVKDILYFGAGCIMKRGYEGVHTDWNCEGSVGWNLGLRPKFLHLSLTYDFSETEISKFVTPELLATADSKWLKVRKFKGKIVYRLLPSPFLPSVVVDKLWQAVKETTGVREVDILPAHPTWMYEKGLGINFCIRRPGTRSFVDIFGKRRDIFYRAGKDLWKTPLFTKTARVLVVQSIPGHDDGNMWVRSSKNFMYLVRGAMNFNGKPVLLKGRVIGLPTLPGGKSWPEGDYDIVTSQHNIKWGEIPAGTIVKMDVQFVLNEQHHDVEENQPIMEQRKLTILTILQGMAKIRPEYLEWVMTSFSRNAMKVAKFVNDYSHLDFEGLIRLLEEDPKSMIALDQALKVRMGLISSHEQLTEIREAQLRKLRSAKVPGQWLAAIARNQVPVGKIWLSIYDKVDMLVNEATVIRYPVTGYQSFLTLEIEYRFDLPKGLAMINGSDAKYLALDGDDHILVTKPFSAFRGGEPVLSERSNSTKLNLDSLSFMTLYTSGANAQGMIGFCFNAMASTLGFAEVCIEGGYTDKANDAVKIAERLGMLLDILAQSIKKPYLLDIESINVASAIQLETAQHPVTAICLSKELDEACQYEWNVTIPDIKPAKVFENGLVKLPEDIVKMMSTGLKKADSALNAHQSYKALTLLNRELTNWVKSQPDLEAAAMTYYTVAVMVHRKKIDHQLIGLMDGSILLLGRTLCEQRYSPLFEC